MRKFQKIYLCLALSVLALPAHAGGDQDGTLSVKLKPAIPIVLRSNSDGIVEKIAKVGEQIVIQESWPIGAWSPLAGFSGTTKHDIPYSYQSHLIRQLDSLAFAKVENSKPYNNDIEKLWVNISPLFRSAGQDLRPRDHKFWEDYRWHAPELHSLYSLTHAFVRAPGGGRGIEDIDYSKLTAPRANQVEDRLFQKIRAIPKWKSLEWFFFRDVAHFVIHDFIQNQTSFVENWQLSFTGQKLMPNSLALLGDSPMGRAGKAYFFISRHRCNLELYHKVAYSTTGMTEYGPGCLSDGKNGVSLFNLKKFSDYWKIRVESASFSFRDIIFLTEVADSLKSSDIRPSIISETASLASTGVSETSEILEEISNGLNLRSQHRTFANDAVIAPSMDWLKHYKQLAALLSVDANRARNQMELSRYASYFAGCLAIHCGLGAPIISNSATITNVIRNQLNNRADQLARGQPARYRDFLSSAARGPIETEAVKIVFLAREFWRRWAEIVPKAEGGSFAKEGFMRGVGAWLLNEGRPATSYFGTVIRVREENSIISLLGGQTPNQHLRTLLKKNTFLPAHYLWPASLEAHSLSPNSSLEAEIEATLGRIDEIYTHADLAADQIFVRADNLYSYSQIPAAIMSIEAINSTSYASLEREFSRLARLLNEERAISARNHALELGGAKFPHDDAILVSNYSLKAGDYIRRGEPIIGYVAAFSYLLELSARSVEKHFPSHLPEGSVVQSELICNGSIKAVEVKGGEYGEWHFPLLDHDAFEEAIESIPEIRVPVTLGLVKSRSRGPDLYSLEISRRDRFIDRPNDQVYRLAKTLATEEISCHLEF